MVAHPLPVAFSARRQDRPGSSTGWRPPEELSHPDGLAPIGWYADPGGTEARRLWDGSRWTEHLWAKADGPAAAPEVGARSPRASTAAARGRLQRWRPFALGALAALVVVFAVLNVDRVRVNWIVTTSQTPLIVVIGLSLVVGIVLGVFAGRLRRGPRPARVP